MTSSSAPRSYSSASPSERFGSRLHDSDHKTARIDLVAPIRGDIGHRFPEAVWQVRFLQGTPSDLLGRIVRAGRDEG